MIEPLAYLGALCVGIAIIAKAGDYFVDSACEIARVLRVSQALVGLTLVAFATSAPEFFTSTIASWLGNVGIAYGNVVGSNIANICLVLAIAMVFGVARAEGKAIQNSAIMLGMGALVALMALKKMIYPFEGVLLLAILALFLKLAFREERLPPQRSSPRLRKPALVFTLSTLGVILGARLLVYSGVGIARALGVPEIAVGFSLIAFGTSIPELATVIISILKRLPELSVGMIVGSNIFNIGSVLGFSALVRGIKEFTFFPSAPIGVDTPSLWFSNPFMLAVFALFLAFTAQGLKRWQGLLFLVLYGAYLVGLGIQYAPTR